MNKVYLIGRPVRDPNISYSQSGDGIAVARFTLAVDRRGKKQEEQQTADFISCVAFKSNAEFAEKYIRQGMKIAVNGRIMTGSYTNKDGQKVYTTDVVVEEYEFCESRNSGSAASSRPEPSSAGDGFYNVPDDIDEDLPFN